MTEQLSLPHDLPPALAGALVRAQAAAQAVVKTSVNEFLHCNYASSEALISEAKAALNGAGLALLPLEVVALEVASNGAGPSRWELHRRYLLCHESGAAVTIGQTWPVPVEKGKPPDKAVAIASTSSLAYALRDLLLIPRTAAQAPGPPPARRSAARPAPSAPAAAPAAPTTPGRAAEGPRPAAPRDGAEFLARLKRFDGQLASQGLGLPGELVSHVQEQGQRAGYPEDLASWPEAAIQVASGWVREWDARRRAKPATGAELFLRLKWRDAALAREKLIAPGALVSYVTEAVGAQGDMASWSAREVEQALEVVRSYEEEVRSGVGRE